MGNDAVNGTDPSGLLEPELAEYLEGLKKFDSVEREHYLSQHPLQLNAIDPTNLEYLEVKPPEAPLRFPLEVEIGTVGLYGYLTQTPEQPRWKLHRSLVVCGDKARMLVEFEDLMPRTPAKCSIGADTRTDPERQWGEDEYERKGLISKSQEGMLTPEERHRLNYLTLVQGYRRRTRMHNERGSWLVTRMLDTALNPAYAGMGNLNDAVAMSGSFAGTPLGPHRTHVPAKERAWGAPLLPVGKVGSLNISPESGQARTVFRGERSSRSPDVVFEQGLQPKGSNTDLLRHATANQPDTNFIATSLRPKIAKSFAGKNGYVYVIRTKNGIDVNVTLGSKSPFPDQFEIAIPGGVGNREIMGAFKMHNGDIVGDLIPNPSYVK